MQIAQHYGDWVATYEWDYFATLTTATPVTKETLVRRYEAWVSALESAGQSEVYYARGLERNSAGDWHLHALVRTPARRTIQDRNGVDRELLGPEHLVLKWKHGRIDVAPYDPARGGARYLAKGYGQNGDGSEYAERLPLSA